MAYFEGTADSITAGLDIECKRKQETRTTPKSGHEQLADFWEHSEMRENWDRSIYQERE